MSPASRQTDLWLERPAVGPIINQLCGVILPGRDYNLETEAEKRFLLPFTKFLEIHRWPALQVHRQAEGGVQPARAVGIRIGTDDRAVEVANAIWQRCGEAGRTSQQVEGVRVAEHRHTGFCRSTRNWDIAIEENVSPEECVGQCDGV